MKTLDYSAVARPRIIAADVYVHGGVFMTLGAGTSCPQVDVMSSPWWVSKLMS